MFKWCRLAAIIGIASLLVGIKPTVAEECGEVTIASMNWASAEIVAEIDKFILSQAFGCKVLLVTGDTPSTFASMTNAGTPDIFPELWVNTISDQLDSAVDGGGLSMAAELMADGGEEGWWIPRYIVDEHPEIKSLADALNRPDLFPSPTDDTQGAVHNCPADWDCQIPATNLFRAYEAEEKGFVLIDTGSAAGLDASIASAYKEGTGWLGYYWAPSSLLGRYDMVRLEAGTHDISHWDSCTAVRDCAEPQMNAWPASPVFSVVTRSFAASNSGPTEYVNARQWSNETVNELLAWMADNQATGDEVAHHFLENYEDVWTNWIPHGLTSSVKAGL